VLVFCAVLCRAVNNKPFFVSGNGGKKKTQKITPEGMKLTLFWGDITKKMIARFWSPLFKQLSKILLGNKPTNIAPMKYISAHRPLFLTFFPLFQDSTKNWEGN